jgi:recombination protein RecR
MQYPSSITNLINELSKLPSVGPKTAERYVFYLLKQNPEELQKLAQAIAELKEKTTVCESCFALSESSPCSMCQDKTRNREAICVVANTRDMLGVEATKSYNGMYHVLNGLLNAVEGIKPENLKLKELEKRLDSGIKELIIALNPNLDGETTAMYIARISKDKKIKTTRLARGLPSGSSLEYMDDMTMLNALKYRNEI